MQENIMIAEEIIPEGTPIAKKKKDKKATAALILSLIALSPVTVAGLVFITCHLALPAASVFAAIAITAVLFIIPVYGWVILGIAMYLVPPLAYYANTAIAGVSMLAEILALVTVCIAVILAIVAVILWARSGRKKKGALLLSIFTFALSACLIPLMVAGLVTDVAALVGYWMVHFKLVLPALQSQFS